MLILVGSPQIGPHTGTAHLGSIDLEESILHSAHVFDHGIALRSRETVVQPAPHRFRVPETILGRIWHGLVTLRATSQEHFVAAVQGIETHPSIGIRRHDFGGLGDRTASAGGGRAGKEGRGESRASCNGE